MKRSKLYALAAVLGFACLTSCGTTGTSASNLKRESNSALQQLYAKTPKARQLGEKASGVLVFPSITKAGFGVGVQSGEGTLFQKNGTVGYYQTTGVSYGLQAGMQNYGYALFLMDAKALQNLSKSDGWEVGSAPSLVVVDEGVSGSLSTTTIQNGTYAFFFNQTGLMAGLGMQGTKITRIEPGR